MWVVGLTMALAAEPYRIAITLDDLPFVGAVDAAGREAATARILGHLAAEKVTAAGFVNCGKPDQALLAGWSAAGHSLGNHTASHLDIDKVPLDRWLDDARACHVALTQSGTPPTTFRYPYLRHGDDLATRDAARAVLTGELGQTIAHVSVDNHDWKLGFWYGDAVASGDAARAAAVAAVYPDHLVDAVRHAREVSRAKLGRDVDHVLLLHANLLAADHLGAALRALRADGAVFIPLEEALRDPVYAMPDEAVVTGGISWLYRIRREVEPSDWETATWHELTARFEPPKAP
jgi:peptidoglycan/xylan/chitin deacetylase (PgdA/CDA1 family)